MLNQVRKRNRGHCIGLMLALCAPGLAPAQGGAAQSTQPPITISAPTARWVELLTYGDLTSTIPVQIRCELGAYSGARVQVAMLASIKDAKTGQTREYLQIGAPEPLNSYRRVLFAAFFMSKVDLVGTGEMTIYLLDEKGKEEVSNRISLPTAGGDATIKELTAKLGPPEIKP